MRLEAVALIRLSKLKSVAIVFFILSLFSLAFSLALESLSSVLEALSLSFFILFFLFMIFPDRSWEENKRKLKWFKRVCGRELYEKVLKEIIAGAKIVQADLGIRLLPSEYYELSKGGLNEEIREKVKIRKFREFARIARNVLPKLIAPHIQGNEHIKRALALQLFAKERLHILLLGDPGTGKSELMRSTIKFIRKSSFGLGSGTTSVGLTVTVKGKHVYPGLLPLADGGIAAIDELNLMKDRDRAGLYDAMSKGEVSYDKGGVHYRFPARVSVLAAANPKGDKFESYDVEAIKRQMPFDEALLSRFHLVFIVKHPTAEQFARIARKVIEKEEGKIERLNEGDVEFLRDYVEFARKIRVRIPKEVQKGIEEFVKEVKSVEGIKTVTPITPRYVEGIVRLAKASARMELRGIVKKEDLEYVLEIAKAALSV